MPPVPPGALGTVPEASTCDAELAKKLSDDSAVGQGRLLSSMVTVPAPGAVKESTVLTVPLIRLVWATRIWSACTAAAAPSPATSAETAINPGRCVVFMIHP